MFTNSLDNKPVITGKNGEIIRDLTQSMFDFTTNSFVPLTAYKVPADFAMRPDLISQAVYNNTAYAEYILKYNGYSNPYTINENDVIIIPDINLAKQNTKTVGSAANDSEKIRNGYKYIDPTKVPKKDQQTNNFDNRTITEGALPANIAQEGEQQITVRNGRVYFGENIGQSSCLKNGMSQSEFITQVIKSGNNNS
jgi:hypothetical protein